jgi:hypothetical protein
MTGHLRERLHHEYWPWYLIYLPVFPLYLYEALRSRRPAFFCDADPGIEWGGFFGERKTDIYALLPEGSYPATVRIAAGTPVHEALRMIAHRGIALPLMVKPDVGERGRGVQRVDNAEALKERLHPAAEDLLVQQPARGVHEFGLMFVRDPGSGRTTLLSITGKRFLTVAGDGKRTVEQLLRLTYRGARQIGRLRVSAPSLLSACPPRGEVMLVEPIGNHCRGTSFHDAGHLRTEDLERSVDALVSRIPGVYYGRFDVRADSEEALSCGLFEVIELNGVSSEPGHIYDPAYSIWRCWGELLRHVRHIARVSRHLRNQGLAKTSMRRLLVRCAAHFGWRFPFRSNR